MTAKRHTPWVWIRLWASQATKCCGPGPHKGKCWWPGAFFVFDSPSPAERAAASDKRRVRSMLIRAADGTRWMDQGRGLLIPASIRTRPPLSPQQPSLNTAPTTPPPDNIKFRHRARFTLLFWVERSIGGAGAGTEVWRGGGRVRSVG